MADDNDDNDDKTSNTLKPSDSGQSKPRARKGRGRPTPHAQESKERNAEPTLTRLLATRVLERVERSQAYADLALHQALARSPALVNATITIEDSGIFYSETSFKHYREIRDLANAVSGVPEASDSP
ncbi:MAG: hypothetical protein QMC73_00435 [Myxococcota bacterium]